MKQSSCAPRGRVLAALFALATLSASKLVVYGPQELIDQFGDQEGKKPVIKANYANFGHIPYGQSLIGNIYIDEENLDLCSRTDPSKLSLEESEMGDYVETYPTKILLAERGNCTFVTKVRNAERAGASLLVVVDSRVEMVENVIMGDDGTGTGIRIPSMLIGKNDGEQLIEFAKKKMGATLAAEFAVKERGEKAEMEIWYSSNNQMALDFIKEFDTYAHKLQGYVSITPRFVTWACPACTSSFKREECFSDGKYCAPNHVKNDFNRIKGVDIMYEDVRQSCLHTNLRAKRNETLWWDYIKEVHKECFGFISKACSKNAHTALGLDWDATDKCVKESFSGADHSSVDNTIMSENAQAWKEYGTFFWPSVVINKMTFRGDITPENILEDVCANLKVKPQVCIDFYKEEHIEYVADVNMTEEEAVSAELLVGVVLVLLLVNVLLILAYRRCVRKEMEDTMGYKVSSAVSQYIAVAQQNRQTATSTSLEMAD